MENMKPTQGVMIHVENDVERFIGDPTDSPILRKYKNVYNDIALGVEKMARLEELILQQKCYNNQEKIKLSFLREYVYARCPFYRRNKSTKDIRVIVSRIDLIYPDNRTPTLEELYQDEDFMRKSKTKLKETMDYELSNTYIDFCNEYE